VGTNPEELLAAAHAGCYHGASRSSVARVAGTKAGNHCDREPGASWRRRRITKSHLDLVARVPGADKARLTPQ